MTMNKRRLTTTLLTSLLCPLLTTAGTVINVDTVRVDVPVGNAPRLPYRLWVTDNT